MPKSEKTLSELRKEIQAAIKEAESEKMNFKNQFKKHQGLVEEHTQAYKKAQKSIQTVDKRLSNLRGQKRALDAMEGKREATNF